MEQLVNFIIRPPRADYDPKHDLLEQEFMLRGKWYQRKDLEVKNGKGEVLQCSHYVPIVSPEGKALPCVIYCHGNSGCRADASEAAIILLPSNITVFALDFSGSGLSGGEHVTLGWNEKDDLKAVVDYLRQDANVSMIGLWGRSMGAVTSLMYGAADPSIAGMVLDSPFSDLVDLMMELVDTYKIRLPKFTVKFAIQYMRRAIQKKAKFDITELNSIKVAKSCFVPALFGHAIDDDFIQPHHADRIYEAYMGDKNIIKFEGDHNSPRPQFYFDSISIFFNNVLQPPEDEVGTSYFNMGHSYVGKDDWSTLRQMGYDLDSPSPSKEPSTSSTANAIKQVRMRRPMSKTEVPSDIADKPSQAEDETVDENDVSSSSGMINFELSDGHPYGPHVPTGVDDDHYVEYQLDDLAGFPCDTEEEERMLMEAVMLSLKDIELQQPLTEEETSTAKHADEGKAVRSNAACKESTSSDHPLTSSNLVDIGVPSNTATPSMTTNQNLATVCLAPGATLPSDLFISKLESESSKTPAALSGSSESIPNSSGSDLSSRTKATLTVERNPANHIMDGLTRRWDFFRNKS